MLMLEDVVLLGGPWTILRFNIKPRTSGHVATALNGRSVSHSLLVSGVIKVLVYYYEEGQRARLWTSLS